MSHDLRDTFALAIGPAASGVGEEITLRRTDQADPLVVKNSFILTRDEMEIMLDYLIDNPDWQKSIIDKLSSKNLIKSIHL